jgi:hypothetical protein
MRREYKDPAAPMELEGAGNYITSYSFDDERVQVHFFNVGGNNVCAYSTMNAGVPVAVAERLVREASAAFMQSHLGTDVVGRQFDGYGG